jgi:hypothetical protein
MYFAKKASLGLSLCGHRNVAAAVDVPQGSDSTDSATSTKTFSLTWNKGSYTI